MAKSIDDLMTLRTITGQQMSLITICSMRRLRLPRRSSSRICTSDEESHVRATGAYDAAKGLSDLFNVRLQNDDVQDFDTRWKPSSIISK